jgi:hypothetical protein
VTAGQIFKVGVSIVEGTSELSSTLEPKAIILALGDGKCRLIEIHAFHESVEGVRCSTDWFGYGVVSSKIRTGISSYTLVLPNTATM